MSDTHSWRGQCSWCQTQASFDELAFLRLWHDWLSDAERPHHLHVLAHSAAPVQAEAVQALAHAHPTLRPLAHELATQCWGLLPGIHRLRFMASSMPPHQETDDQLTLTLCIGPHNQWPEFAQLLHSHSTGPCAEPAELRAQTQRSVTVVGAGIAGAGTARALAERGWQVTVLEAGTAPAAGASGLPVGVVAPHTSHDDSAVSRLSRAGLRLMTQTMRRLLREGVDWGATGVRERLLPGKTRRGGVPLSWLHEHADTARDWTQPAPPPAPDDAYWHPHGAWLRPAELVRALLAHPNIRWQGLACVDGLRHSTGTGTSAATVATDQIDATAPSGAAWQVLQGQTVLAQSSRVVLAAGPATAALIAKATHDGSHPRITPLRGQISWGLMADIPDAPLPASPVNGNGSFVHHIASPEGPAWFAGSTFDRLNDQPVLLDSDHAENLARLQALEPATAQALAPIFSNTQPDNTNTPYVRGWAGVRCGVHDRLPMTGRVPNTPEGLYMNTAMGSRGLTLGLLCGELLAAQWHGEPLAIEARLARFLDAMRFETKAQSN